jgi:hypothetical protein
MLGEIYCWIWRAGLLCLAVGGFVPLAAPPKNRPTSGHSSRCAYGWSWDRQLLLTLGCMNLLGVANGVLRDILAISVGDWIEAGQSSRPGASQQGMAVVSDVSRAEALERTRGSSLPRALSNKQVHTMAGPGNNPVQVFATCRDLHWEFLRLWTGFELSSSSTALPCYRLP